MSKSDKYAQKSQILLQTAQKPESTENTQKRAKKGGVLL